MKLFIIIAALACLMTLILAEDANTQIGINCRGSTMCSGCKQPLGDGGMLDFIKQNLSDDALYTNANGKQIACKSCHLTKNEGSCASLVNTGGNTITGKMIKDAMQRLKDHGCDFCGSAPFWENDMNKGGITVNYVTDGCVKHGDKIC